MLKIKVFATALAALVLCTPRVDAATPSPSGQGEGAAVPTTLSPSSTTPTTIVAPTTSQAPSRQQQTYDGGSFAWPTSPGVGHMGLYIDDDISHTRLMSTLRNSTGKLCKSVDDAACAGSTLSVYAILPPCGSTSQIDCIESIGSKAKGGTTETATFSRLFPEAGLADFVGEASARVPTGSSPSIWTLPSTPHNAGNEYMAIVAVSGYSTSARQALASPIIHASLYPVKVVTGRFARNVPLADRSGVSHPSNEPWANCATVAEGACAARQDFPADTAFSLSVRLSTAPTGWLHGRIFDPDISFSTSAGVTTLRVQANPAQVPAVATWTRVDKLPDSLVTGGCTITTSCGQSNPQSSGATSAVENWRPYYEDKAAWVRGHWMFMTLNDSTGAIPTGTPGGGSPQANCLAETGVLHGFVTTNATGYAAGPPNYSQADKSFSYTVASPHYNERGQEIVGTYNFVMRSATARCLYGIGEGRLSARVSISQSDGKDRTADVAVEDDGTWLKVSVSGFHYSSPVIKTTLISGDGVIVSTTSTTPATASPTVLLPVTTTTLPVTSRQPTLTTKRSASAVAVARYAGMKVAAGARVALNVRPGSATVCRMRGAVIVGLKKGTCRVTAFVTPRGGKTASRSVNLVVPS